MGFSLIYVAHHLLEIRSVMLEGISFYLAETAHRNHTYRGSNSANGSCHATQLDNSPRTEWAVLGIMQGCVPLPAWVHDGYVTIAPPGRWKAFYDPPSLPFMESVIFPLRKVGSYVLFCLLFYSWVLCRSQSTGQQLREIQNYGSHLLSLETWKAGFGACTVLFAQLKLRAAKGFSSIF